MPRRAHVRIVKLRKWFPPDDVLGVMVARLCILREDLLLEMHGVYTEEVKTLDQHSAQFRRMYFLRNLVRTLTELSSAIQRLLANSEFKEMLEQQPDDVKARFADAASLMAKAHPVVKDVRNDISGHVRESAVRAGLERLDWDAFGLFDVGPNERSTHYKFAGELTAEILLKDVTQEERRNISSSKFATIANLMEEIFALIGQCLLMYVEKRGLL